GDEFEFETGFFFGDRWHIFQTITTQINSPKNASSKLIVMIRATSMPIGYVLFKTCFNVLILWKIFKYLSCLINDAFAWLMRIY
ncbi:MAG: hypothetical protein JWQ71_2533, partial [Pedosphaera sp.]|nr:hypothetical protein [Pedosphaera sp.]